MSVPREEVPYSRAIADRARLDGNAPCLLVDETATPIGRLDRRANAVAWTLHESGVAPGGLVAILLPNSEEFFAAAFGAWKIGATPLPLPTHLPEAELGALLQVAQPAAVVRQVSQDERADPPAPPGIVSQPAKASASGGSTGRPKIILDNKPSVLVEGGLGFGYEDGPAIYVGGPVYHTGPLIHAVEGILRGRLVLMQSRFDPEGALSAIATYQAHFAALVPTMMHRIWRLPADVRDRYDVASLRYVWHTAAPCPQWLKAWWIDWLGATTLNEVYGSTESIATTKIRGDEWLDRPGSVGRAFFGETRIVGDDGQEVEAGQVGEIFMRSASESTPFSYLGEPTRRLRAGGWESMGDVGWKDADGYLYLADRRTDLIITGGENVYPSEVEAAIDRHPAVVTSAVYGLSDDDRGQIIAATVQVDTHLSAPELREFLLTQVARYKVPRTFEFTTESIRNDAGKLSRAEFSRRRMCSGVTQ